MENLSHLGGADGGRGSLVRLADPGGDKALRGGGGKAAPDAARRRVPGGVGRALCPDGHWRGAGVYGPGLGPADNGAGGIRRAAGGELPVEHPLF